MDKIDGVALEVLQKTEWVAIALAGPDGPHVVATWGDYIRSLGIEPNKLLAPAGLFNRTEAMLKNDPRVEVLAGSRAVAGENGPGKGCALIGTAELQYEGDDFAKTKAQFPWARAVLVIRVEKVELQL